MVEGSFYLDVGVMKELEKFNKDIDRDQVFIEQQKVEEVEYKLEESYVPKRGHKTWEINLETFEVLEATYVEAKTLAWEEAVSKKTNSVKDIVRKPGFAYIGALNPSSALKRLKSGKGSSKVEKGKYNLSNPFK